MANQTATLAALAAHRKAKGNRVTDEADQRDLITDLLVMLRQQGKDIAAELRMAAGNAGIDTWTTPLVLVTVEGGNAITEDTPEAQGARAYIWDWDNWEASDDAQRAEMVASIPECYRETITRHFRTTD